MQSHLFFVLLFVAFHVISKNSLLRPVSWSFSSMFSFGRFMVSGLIFKSLIYFLHVVIQFIQNHFSKKLSFPHWVFLAFLSNVSWPHMCGFIFGLLILFCVCFYASTISFWLLQLASGVWNREVWCPCLCSFILGFHWLLWVFCGSIQTLVLFFSVINTIGILIGLLLNLYSFWYYGHFNILIYEHRISFHLCLLQFLIFIIFY